MIVKVFFFSIKLLIGNFIVYCLMEILVMDYILFEKLLDGWENVLVMMDIFFKFMQVILIRDQKVVIVVKVLVKEWFVYYGILYCIYSD